MSLHHMHAVPTETRRGRQSPLELEVQKVARHPVSAGKGAWVTAVQEQQVLCLLKSLFRHVCALAQLLTQ